jgi:trigger factor
MEFTLKIEMSRPSTTTVEFKIELPQDSIRSAYDRKLSKYKKEVSMKGFRPGKVPQALLIARYGESIRQEAVEETVDSVLKDEFKKSAINPISQGKIEDFKDDKESPITFRAIVEVDPEIEVTGYENLGITPEATTVAAQEVEAELKGLGRRFSKENKVERAAANGDVIAGKYLQIVIEGDEHPIPENPAFRMEIGGSSMPGFDDALVGASVGDIKELEFTYGEDFQEPSLRGKKAFFKIEVEGVFEVVLPEWNAEELSRLGVESLEQLRERIEKNLLERKEGEARNVAYEQAIQVLMEKNPIDVPESRVYYYTRASINNQKGGKQQAEVEPTQDDLDQYRDQALFDIRRHRILKYIADKEKIRAKQADVDARIAQMAAMYGMNYEDLKNSMRQSGRIVELRDELQLEKTLDYLVGIRETEEVKA